MVTRRRVVIALGAGALAAPLATFAQQQERRVQRIGYLGGATVQAHAGYLAAFRQGLTELRWVEGRDYVIDARYANGVSQAAPRLAAELVASQPDLLMTAGDSVLRALAQSTKTIPIVFCLGSDPVGIGVAASLQRPGGNVTGFTYMATELGAKRLQLLKEVVPRIAHVVLLFEPDVLGLPQAKEIEAAAARLKIRVSLGELRQAADIEQAFKRGAALGAQAYVVTSGPLINANLRTIADHLLRAKVPAIFAIPESVEAGGLMSYSPSNQDNYRRAAAHVDKILKGAKPGDIPIEQPTRFEFNVNMKTAKALGIKIPQSIMLRADRVIE